MCELPVWGNPYVRQVNRQVINKLGVQECAEILSVYSPPFFRFLVGTQSVMFVV